MTVLKKTLIAGVFVLLLPAVALAASDLEIKTEDIKFSIPKPLAGDIFRLYATVRNRGCTVARGWGGFFGE